MGCNTSQSIYENKIECPMLEFMTLFEKKDFNKHTFYKSRVEKAYKVASKLPGRFKAYVITDIKHEQLIIKGMPQLYVLYIKLPKEKIWIASDLWEEEFLNAQMIETIHIWTQLGANEIKFSANRSSKNNKSLIGDIGVGLPGQAISFGGKYNLDDTEESDLSGHIKLQDVKMEEYKDRQDFIEKNNLYYIKFAPEWLNIINYKLGNDGLKQLDFQYTFAKGLYCNSKLNAKFNEIGISFGTSSNESLRTIVKYNIIFQVPEQESESELDNTTTIECSVKVSVPNNSNLNTNNHLLLNDTDENNSDT
jgi:hypothetical protein